MEPAKCSQFFLVVGHLICHFSKNHTKLSVCSMSSQTCVCVFSLHLLERSAIKSATPLVVKTRVPLYDLSAKATTSCDEYSKLVKKLLLYFPRLKLLLTVKLSLLSRPSQHKPLCSFYLFMRKYSVRDNHFWQNEKEAHLRLISNLALSE